LFWLRLSDSEAALGIMKSNDRLTVIDDRPISAQEIAVVTWLLNNASVQGALQHLVSTVPSLHVVSRCDCGCASVDFERDGQGCQAGILADAMGKTMTGLKCGLILWGHQDRITGLEIYELDSGSASALPSTEMLMSWS
jgi:hypothetical protein